MHESLARKLRLEAAKVEKASAAIDRANTHSDHKQLELASRREAAKTRRQQLLESVRATREARQADKTARQAALAALEDNASVKRAKVVSLIQTKGRSDVQHAIAVAAALKEKKASELKAAAARLHAKLAAAEARRAELIETSSGAAVGMVDGPDNRLARIHDESCALEEKRSKLACSMGRAVGKRAALIDSIAARALRERARRGRGGGGQDSKRRHRAVDFAPLNHRQAAGRAGQPPPCTAREDRYDRRRRCGRA